LVSALVVAVCALLFTVGSFYWLNARQGSLKSFEPHTFAAAVGGKAVLRLRFPLVFYNSGAKPIVVQDLRLAFPDVPSSVLPLAWSSSRTQLKPEAGDVQDFPSVFAVQGRTAQRHFIEFADPFSGFSVDRTDYRVRVEAELGHKRGWTTIVEFTLRAGVIVHPANYVTYSNSPRNRTADEVATSAAAMRDLMQRLGSETADDDGS
jgi:hypothetical protein